MDILKILDKELLKIFNELSFDKKFAFFLYSDRPDLSDFQTNCAMPLCKILKKSPKEIAKLIVEKLKNLDFFEKISIDGPGFINIIIKNDFLLRVSNSIFNDKKIGCTHNEKSKKVMIEFSSPNVAKEMHVGHLRSTIIGESLQRIFKFAGDEVTTDNHLGDWGTNMGMVIEAIRNKYPNAKCFQKDFDDDKIDDLNLKPEELLELYKYSNNRAKEDKEFYAKIQESTRLLQSGDKAIQILWKYFWNISLDDMNDIYKILDVHFDLVYGESFYEELCEKIINELTKNGKAIVSEGALVIDLQDLGMPPFLLTKTNGTFLYSTTDLATINFRIKKFNFDVMLYIVDYRQSLHFKQVFESAKRVGYLGENNIAEHVSYGTMNGKDNKPFKTRNGDVVKLRDLINETTAVIKEKSTIKDEDIIQKIAVACLKFADLINFRESSYIFDMEQFTNFEGKTGAYILYNLVRIKSILENYKNFDCKITEIRVKEEKELLLELAKFSYNFKLTYEKRAPHFLAEYVYNVAKKFSSFYSVAPINNETDENYKKSKISILYLTKKYLEITLDLLGIATVEKM